MRSTGLFSGFSKAYARFRPAYPSSLIDYLAGLAPDRHLAWDCGTGNGQAASELARHFNHVIATDIELSQLSYAVKKPNISFLAAQAEFFPLSNEQLDIVIVAQAIHWFELDEFYSEVKRALKPSGVLAAWCYHLCRTEQEIDHLIYRFYHDTLGDFWSPRIRYIEEKYQTIPFPFQEIEPPSFEMITNWNLVELAGYLSTWSAVAKYTAAMGKNPMVEFYSELENTWGDPARKRELIWPIFLRVWSK